MKSGRFRGKSTQFSVSRDMGEERRKYYRYPTMEGSQAVVVRHGGVERAAKLVNQSADGFRLDMDVESIVEVGDIVLLATSYGFHRVRVVNVARENGTLQLGLQRLQDLPASAVSQEEAREKGGKRARKSSHRASLLQLAVPTVLGALILVGIGVAWQADVDPAGVLAKDKTFVTPTSEYNARRRRAGSASDETTSSSDKQTRRSSRGVPSGQSAQQPYTRMAQSPARASTTTIGNGGLPGPQSAQFADASPSTPGQSAAGPLFDASTNAIESIDAALKTANRENKRVLVEFGANECDSCNQLHAAFTKDSEIAGVFQKAFVLVSVDIDSNQKLVARYGSDEPHQHAPFLALLDKAGNILKRRKIDELGAGSKLDPAKVKEFLQQWSSAS